MQIQITLVPEQEKSHELDEVLRAFATDYETWMIRSIKSGKHTLHDEAGDLIASLEIVKGARANATIADEGMTRIGVHERQSREGQMLSR